jgi:hypothetical protein
MSIEVAVEPKRWLPFNWMVGKTVTSAQEMERTEFDDAGFLKLEFSDGTDCVIVSGYYGHTGNSEDEYPTWIKVVDGVDNLIPTGNEK